LTCDQLHHSEKSPVKMNNPPFLSQNRFRQNRVTTITDPESCLTNLRLFLMVGEEVG